MARETSMPPATMKLTIKKEQLNLQYKKDPSMPTDFTINIETKIIKVNCSLIKSLGQKS